MLKEESLYVMGLVKQGGQYQVIIGNNVAAAYKEILPLGVEGSVAQGDAPKEKQKWTPKRVGMTILDAIIGTMTPLIPAIIGGSMVKLLAMLLLMTSFPYSAASENAFWIVP